MARKKKTETKSEPKMFRFEVYDDSYVDEHEPLGGYSDEEYSMRGDTSTSHSVMGIYPHQHGDIVTDLDLKADETAYLVYVVRSTGDSFGSDRGRYLTCVHLFDTSEKANACVKAIEEHYSRRKDIMDTSLRTMNADTMGVKFIGNDGNETSEYAEWIGYFDSLDYAEVEHVTVFSDSEIKRLKREHKIW